MMNILFKIKVAVVVVLILGFGVDTLTYSQNYRQPADTIVIGETELKLIDGIRDMNKRKEAIAYNIANVTTPGFRPKRFQDEIDEAIRLYGDPTLLEEVNIDDEMLKSTKVRLKHQAYIRLLSTKMAITKRVVTLGKGG